ncbi:hypothetical protein JW756_06795 [Candidatus Woesearchaeota archaeon]|nr:hypothetical protein [Candidatus Woesearchaeota archaeon]
MKSEEKRNNEKSKARRVESKEPKNNAKTLFKAVSSPVLRSILATAILSMLLALIVFPVSGVMVEVNQEDLQLSYTGDINLDSGTLFLNAASDLVGVGTANPQQKLDVNGSINIVGSDIWDTGIYILDTKAIRSSNSESGTLYYDIVNQYFRDPSASYAIVMSLQGGGVGIGTYNPANKLTVIGDINATDNISTAKICLNGDCITAWPAGGSGTDSGWNDTGTIMQLTTSTDKVGIGTTSPNSKLAVDAYGVIGSANNAYYDIGAGRIAAGSSIYSYGAICSGNSIGNCSGSSGVIIRGGAMIGSPNVAIAGSGNSYFNAGNIGIGTTSPGQKLEVVGNANVTGTLTVGGTVIGGIPSGMIAMFDTACPTGWTQLSASFNGRFPRVAATYGGTGGSSTHTHTIDPPSTATNAQAGSWNKGSLAGGWDLTGGHNHSVDIPPFSSESADNIPPYIDVVFCKKN